MLTMDQKAAIEAEVYAKEFSKKIREELKENKSWLISNIEGEFLEGLVRTEYEKRAEKYASIVEERLKNADEDIEKILNTFTGRSYIHGNTLAGAVLNHMTAVIERVVKEHLESSTMLRGAIAKRVTRIVDKHVFKDEAKSKLYKSVCKKMLAALESIDESKEVLDEIEFIKTKLKSNLENEIRYFAHKLCEERLEKFREKLEEQKGTLVNELEQLISRGS